MINTIMKINEIIQPSAKSQIKMLTESWGVDTDSPFSKIQHQVIAEDVVNAKFSGKPKTIEEFKKWLDSV